MATGNPFRLIGFSDLDRNNPCFFGRIVVSAGEQGVPDKNHLADCDAQNVSEFSDPVGFVYALLGDIDGSRPTQAHGKLGIDLSSNAFICFRLEKPGSHFFFSSKGAS